MVDFVKLSEEGDKPERKRRSRFSFRKFFLFLLVFFILSSLISALTASVTPKIAVIPIKGVIMTEKVTTIYGGSVSSREIANQILDLGLDSSVKAILLDINSGGGSPVASEEISLAIEKVKAEKPVYAVINDIGASGAFWIAVSADKVFVSSMSTVGSIGVTSAGLGFEDFIREHNISYRRQTAGEFKDIGTPFRKPTDKEEEIIQNLLDDIHSKFISHVAESRNLSYEYVKNYSNGEIFLGSRAKEIGFVDEIGYYQDVIDILKNETNASLVVNYGPLPTLLESLSSSAFSNLKFGSNSLILLK